MSRNILSHLSWIPQLFTQNFLQCKCSYNLVCLLGFPDLFFGLFVCLFMAAGKNAISMIALPLGHIWWHNVHIFSQTKRDHCNDSGRIRENVFSVCWNTHTHIFIYSSLPLSMKIVVFWLICHSPECKSHSNKYASFWQYQSNEIAKQALFSPSLPQLLFFECWR